MKEMWSTSNKRMASKCIWWHFLLYSLLSAPSQPPLHLFHRLNGGVLDHIGCYSDGPPLYFPLSEEEGMPLLFFQVFLSFIKSVILSPNCYSSYAAF